MSRQLEGKAALVTGGSRGIGAAIAKRLAADGATVAITYTKGADAAASVVKEIEGAGGKAIAFQADASDAEAVNAAVEKTVATFGRLDVLFNNAGFGASAPIEWVPSASISGGVTFLVVEGGTGRNMFLVNNTSSLYYETYLSTGGGTVTNTVDVYATTGALDIDGGASIDNVNVGEGSLAGINGPVDVFNSSPNGSSNLYIDDSFDFTGRPATLFNGELTGLAYKVAPSIGVADPQERRHRSRTQADLARIPVWAGQVPPRTCRGHLREPPARLGLGETRRLTAMWAGLAGVSAVHQRP